jgi:formate/nitrite transporter FocA (FNT family)
LFDNTGHFVIVYDRATQGYLQNLTVLTLLSFAGLAATAPGIAAFLGGMVFPIGLSMIIFTGTELLTSNMLYTTLPFLSHPEGNAQRWATLTRVISVWKAI